MKTASWTASDCLPSDNGATEELNNKTKVLNHRSYGFRSATYDMPKPYHCMADLPRARSMQRFV
jgi:hypothetical protein